MPRNVLISAFIGSKNLGDEAIFESILANIDFKGATVSALSVNPPITLKKGVVALNANSPIGIYHAIKQTDVVIMGGGGIIQDQSSILNILYYTFQLFIAKIHKKPVILAFVGVGPLRFGISKWLLAKSSSCISLAIVRDNKSKRLLKGVCNNLNVLEYYDPVLNYPATVRHVSGDEQPQDIIMVSLRQWFFSIPMLPASAARRLNALGVKSNKYKKLTTALAHTFDQYLDENESSNLQFVSFYDTEDLRMTSDVLMAMRHKERCHEPSSNLSAQEYINLVARVRFLVGIRLHSLIMASIVGTPFVAINYSPKVKSFAEMMNQADVMCDINNFDSKKLLNNMNVTKDSANRRSDMIKSQWEIIRHSNQEAFNLISREIAKY